MITLNAASEWGSPPWIVTGENLTPWKRFRWRARYEYVSDLFARKQKAEMDKVEQERRRLGRKG